MKVLFHENFLNKRGTSTALFDYAYHNQTILGNESIIVTDGLKPNDPDVVKKFKSHFNVLHYENFSQVDKIIEEKQVDVFYAIKSGEKDGIVSNGAKNVIHSVFCADLNQIHGDVYVTVSEWLSSVTSGKISYVPHMINIPDVNENLRTTFNIPVNAVVIGRHGGIETFDIQFAMESVIQSLRRTDIYYIFLNTYKFIDHPRVIFINATADMNFKIRFINTCDAMLHARSRGESFGLSVLEFACKNKHIITYGQSPEKNHLLYLDKNCSVYNDKQQLNDILYNISRKNPYNTMYLNEMFSPQSVMTKFKQTFLQ